ncbi:CBS domain-containing protein [Streptomyces griseus]|uniref:CBS domain-containing protein n=1 Tax=Streptomyces griseus TaxID=1911 RepID=UPI00083FFEE1|nr:CBS domain-containing protein [Streptomyces griseus]
MTTSPHTVSDLMTHTAVAVGSRASYKDIVRLLDEWKVSALPVLAGEGRVIGVVSEADLLPKEENRPDETSAPGDRPFADASKAEALYAEQLMSSPAVTVHADATVAEAARIMARRQVKRLPVVDSGGLLQGIISRADLLKVFLRSDEDIADETLAVLGGLPAAADMAVHVDDGVVTLGGSLSDRALVPLIARAVRAVEGVVDIRLDLLGHREDPPAG